jgi:hypothetical protein
MFPKNNDNNITTESILDEIRKLYREKQTFDQSYHNNLDKNILLIGRRNIGKTTLKNILQDPCYIPDESSLFSGTPSIILHPLFPLSDSNLSLRIVETSIPFERSNDEDLWKINRFCIENQIKRFNLICFCRSFDTNINNGDIEILNKLVNHFGQQICSQLCLIITRCESKDNDQLKYLLNELKNDQHFQTIIPYFQQRIYFTGSINRDNFNRKYHDLIYAQFETVYGYRQNLIQLIQNATNSFPIQPKTQQPMSAARSQQNYSTLQTNIQTNDHRHEEKQCCELL